MKNILFHVLTFVNDNWELLAPVIYEILARLIPTKNNVSIVDNVVKIIRFIIPNKRKPLPTDVPVQADPHFNRVIVDRTKHIIPCIAFLLLSVAAFGQTNGTFKTVRFLPVQDTTVLNTMPSQFPIGTVTRLANDTLYYKFPDGFWHPLTGGGGGGGGLTTADNGLTATGANVQLGGPLIQNTAIDGDFDLRIGAATALNEIVLGSEVGTQINSFGSVQLDGGTFVGVTAFNTFSSTVTQGGAPTSTITQGVQGLAYSTTDGINYNNTFEVNQTAIDFLVNHGGSAINFLATDDNTNYVTTGSLGNTIDFSLQQLVSGNQAGISVGNGVNLSSTDGGTSAYGNIIADFSQSYIEQSDGASELSSIYIDPALITVSSTGNFDLAITGNILLNGDAGAAGEFFAADGTWQTPAGGGATADNGLTETGGNIQLGGPLIQNTVVNGATGTHDLTFGELTNRLDQYTSWAQTGQSINAYNGTNIASISMTSAAGQIIETSQANHTIQHSTQIAATNTLLNILKKQTEATSIGRAVVITNEHATNTGTGFGLSVDYALSNNSGNEELVMSDETSYTTATNNAEYATWVKNIISNGSMVDAISITTNAETTLKIHDNGTPTNVLQLTNEHVLYSEDGTPTDDERSVMRFLVGNTNRQSAVLEAIHGTSISAFNVTDGDLGEIATMSITDETAGELATIMVAETGISINATADTAADTDIVIRSQNEALAGSQIMVEQTEITLTPQSGGFIVFDNLPANCTGAPTGALANVSGTLTVCP